MTQIEIYRDKDKGTHVEVRFDGDSAWLTQKQIATLFKTTPQNITIHLKKIYKEDELEEKATCKDYLQVQKEGKRQIQRKQRFYNLDAIISVGYRINSKRGTQFRQWATQRLKDHLVKGYTLNEKQLLQNLQHLDQVSKTIQRIGKGQLNLSEAKGLLSIISSYTQSFILLNQFDTNRLKTDELSENITYEIRQDEALEAIRRLKIELMARKEASDLFGNQKDDSFAGVLGSVVQSFGGEYLYKSIEEQAAHLLYFIIKNHPFSDGNKRIGAFLFIWFLEKNKHRFKKTGELKINDNALVALALLVAQSHPSDKELMIKLIINLING